MQITEQWILSHAPSPAVAEDARALCAAGNFDQLSRTEDGKTYWAECLGSAQNPYHVSIDWSLSEKEPIYGCSCSSRHFPCKHVLGLMYEIMDGTPFSPGSAPSYVRKARTKAAAERAKAEARLEQSRKYGAAIKGKKLERQFEGLEKAEKIITALVSDGLSCISDLPAQSLDRLAAEFRNRRLTGAQDAFERLALLERQMRQDEAHAKRYYREMLAVLAEMRVMIQKSRRFLAEQRTSASYDMEDPFLYELLGGVWNSDELLEIGAVRKNARLVQLSFDVSYDEAKRAYLERGFWLELSRGDIVHTLTVSPAKQAKYTPSDDSCFELLEIPVLYETPIVPCPRAWWDNAVSLPLSGEDRASLRDYADERLASAVETARDQLREPLLSGVVPSLVTVGRIGCADGELVLEDAAAERIALRDRREDGAELRSVCRLTSLPKLPEEGDALFGLMFYDGADHRICLQPYSFVTADDVVRLQF